MTRKAGGKLNKLELTDAASPLNNQDYFILFKGGVEGSYCFPNIRQHVELSKK